MRTGRGACKHLSQVDVKSLEHVLSGASANAPGGTVCENADDGQQDRATPYLARLRKGACLAVPAGM